MRAPPLGSRAIALLSLANPRPGDPRCLPGFRCRCTLAFHRSMFCWELQNTWADRHSETCPCYNQLLGPLLLVVDEHGVTCLCFTHLVMNPCHGDREIRVRMVLPVFSKGVQYHSGSLVCFGFVGCRAKRVHTKPVKQVYSVVGEGCWLDRIIFLFWFSHPKISLPR